MLGVCHNLGFFLVFNWFNCFCESCSFCLLFKNPSILDCAINQVKLSALSAEPCQTLKLRCVGQWNVFLALFFALQPMHMGRKPSELGANGTEIWSKLIVARNMREIESRRCWCWRERLVLKAGTCSEGKGRVVIGEESKSWELSMRKNRYHADQHLVENEGLKLVK